MAWYFRVLQVQPIDQTEELALPEGWEPFQIDRGGAGGWVICLRREEAGPHITGLDPAAGAVDSAVTITVEGGGFEEASEVEVDGVACPTTFDSSNRLLADFTPSAPGLAAVTVRNADASESNSVPFAVT